MRFRATIKEGSGGYIASCLDLEACGEGSTRASALASLRKAIRERERPEGVALPDDAGAPSIDLVVVENPDERASHEPSGPGDAG